MFTIFTFLHQNEHETKRESLKLNNGIYNTEKYFPMEKVKISLKICLNNDSLTLSLKESRLKNPHVQNNMVKQI